MINLLIFIIAINSNSEFKIYLDLIFGYLVILVH